MTKQDFLAGKEFFPLKYTIAFNRKGCESEFGGTLFKGDDYFCEIFKHNEEGFYLGKLLFDDKFISYEDCVVKEADNE